MNIENGETIKNARKFITGAIEALDVEMVEAEKRIKDSIGCKVPTNLWDRQSITIFQKEKVTLQKTLKMLDALEIIKTDPVIKSTIETVLKIDTLLKCEGINWHKLSEEQISTLREGLDIIET